MQAEQLWQTNQLLASMVQPDVLLCNQAALKIHRSKDYQLLLSTVQTADYKQP